MTGLIIDLFAGGGGASVGVSAALGREPDIAVNHDEIAITVHEKNHPTTSHYTEDIFAVDPEEAVRGRAVDVLWASPDCTHHSRAKGDVPRDQGIRALADVIIPWARKTKPRFIFVENVPEFENWGPLSEDGRPDKSRKGHLFLGWIAALRQLGYKVEWRVLNCSEYGAPTKRMRLFIVARRDGRDVEWPEKTHGPGREHDLVPAWRCIDWSIPCPSIFLTPKEVKEQGLRVRRPLAEKTMARIANGVRRYVLEAQEPFLIRTGHWNATTGEGSQFRGQGLTKPLAAVCATNDKALVTPLVTKINHGLFNGKDSDRSQDIQDPLTTVCAQRRGHALIAPSLVRQNGGNPPTSVEDPTNTITTQENRHTLVAAFLAKHFGGVVGHDMHRPIGTVTARDHHALAAASLVKFRGTSQGHMGQPDIEEPIDTISAGGNHMGQVQAFLTKYHGCPQETGQSLFDSMHTVTGADRFGLVVIQGQAYQIVDIGMRMLMPHELLAAQFGEFASSYSFDVTKTNRYGKQVPLAHGDKVRLIGNSVPPHVVRALVSANCTDLVVQEMAA